MTGVVLNDGRPVLVESQDDRIGRGPWARWLATAVVPDEGSTRAERGRTPRAPASCTRSPSRRA